MRRRIDVLGWPLRVFAATLLTTFLAATPLHAGFTFSPVETLPGANATALAGNGATLWAATPGGVWRLEAGAWTLDGLSGRTISAIVVADAVYAADGEKVWKRAADGRWAAEALPPGLAFPSVLATDGTAVWAAGIGVAKRAGGSWTALTNPGGAVTAACVFSGDLVVGLRGGAARYAGSSVSAISSGIPFTATVQTLGVASGVLYAGTEQTLYSFFGGTWTPVAGFGLHDVRAVTDGAGATWIATADAGVLWSASGWAPANAGLLIASAKSFAKLGSDLYVGTAGAPVYRLSGSSWIAAGTGLYAASISEVRTVIGETFVGAHGAGIAVVPNGNFLPDGCGDVRAMTADSLRVYASTNCRLYAWPLGPNVFNPPSILEAGLPAGVVVSSLAAVPNGTVAGGTPNAGMWRLVESTWSSDNTGLPANGSVLTTREVGGKLYATVGSSFFVRQQSAWQAVSGAPSFVQAIGGDTNVLFAASVSGGVSSSAGAWREDDFGASTSFVSSIDADGRFAVAGAGQAGVLRRVGGGWQPENTGLPPGADVRVVRRSGDAGNLYAGTSGHGLFLASTTPITKYVPVVLDLLGAAGSHFRSDLTLGNRAATPVTVTVGFTHAPDFPLASSDGSVTVTLAPRSELRAPDALQFFRDRGLTITASPSGTAGSIWIAGNPQALPMDGTDAVYAFSRAYTAGSAGSFGTFLDAPSDLDAAESEGAVYGLRSVLGGSRSNLAVGHIPGRGAQDLSLSIQVYDQSGAAAGAPLATTLRPGEWRQFNGILGLAGLPDGAYGYAKITRTAGIGSWTAYGVVNDAVTSDGSILPLYRPGGLAAARKLVVPVVLDVFGAAGSHYTTELTLANDGNFATPVDLVYRPAPGFGSSAGVAVVTLALAAHQQTTIPDVIAFLRSKGVNIPDPSQGAQAGSLSVDFRNLGTIDSPRTVAIARTTTPNTDTATGGSFGVAYPAAAKGGGARVSALVPGLTRDASVRSNLAVVHLGGGSEIALALSVRLYDAATSLTVGNPITVTLQPGDWTQWSGVFETAGVPAGTTAAYAIVTRLSGDDTWLAYGVLNDAKTSDGSVLKMISGAEY
ncbi:MAG: hypothetical protein ABI584_13765 [Acidobacteriota bacterium]